MYKHLSHLSRKRSVWLSLGSSGHCRLFPFGISSSVHTLFITFRCAIRLFQADIRAAIDPMEGICDEGHSFAQPLCLLRHVSRSPDAQSAERSTWRSVRRSILKLKRSGASHSAVPGSRELVKKARGVFFFHCVVEATLIVGGQHGGGALRMGGTTRLVQHYVGITGTMDGRPSVARKQSFRSEKLIWLRA